MQLVLSNNRIIAHGENFLSMGGVVINTETGAKYENATIAECEGGCPSDIDRVGYEYHAGVFVPCAPFGKGNGNGYFMEVCPDCATPRNSGIPIKDMGWQEVSSVVINKTGDNASTPLSITMPFSANLPFTFSAFRYKIKSGTFSTIYRSVTPFSISLLLGNKVLYSVVNNIQRDYSLNVPNLSLPFLFSLSTETKFDTSAGYSYTNYCYFNGGTISPLVLTLNVPFMSSANFTLVLEGRK